MQNEIKFVNFDSYCNRCKNQPCDSTEDPCNECLTNPTNIDSHKPVNFVEKIK